VYYISIPEKRLSIAIAINDYIVEKIYTKSMHINVITIILWRKKLSIKKVNLNIYTVLNILTFKLNNFYVHT
jgi:hypothetical protein